MLRLFLTLLCLVLGSATAFADVPCAGSTCSANYLCLDRGNGEGCYQICRWDFQCESQCCIQIWSPQTAWICGASSECGVDPGTDGDTDDGSLTDGDASSDDRDPVEPTRCGDVMCTSFEACITLDDDREECAPICSAATDCASGCCAATESGRRVCMPADIECPQDQEGGDSDSIALNTDDSGGCDQTGISTILSWLFLALGGVLLARRRRA